MITFASIALAVAGMGALDALSHRYGVETRPGFDGDHRHPLS